MNEAPGSPSYGHLNIDYLKNVVKYLHSDPEYQERPTKEAEIAYRFHRLETALNYSIHIAEEVRSYDSHVDVRIPVIAINSNRRYASIKFLVKELDICNASPDYDLGGAGLNLMDLISACQATLQFLEDYKKYGKRVFDMMGKADHTTMRPSDVELEEMVQTIADIITEDPTVFRD